MLTAGSAGPGIVILGGRCSGPFISEHSRPPLRCYQQDLSEFLFPWTTNSPLWKPDSISHE